MKKYILTIIALSASPNSVAVELYTKFPDVMGTCEQLATHSKLTSFKEISISTGLSHGTFFLPLPEWVVPLKEWIRKTNR